MEINRLNHRFGIKCFKRTPLKIHRLQNVRASEHQTDTGDNLPNRRYMLTIGSFLGLGPAFLNAAIVEPAFSALVEDDVSMRVFEVASESVVSIVNYKNEAGVSVAESIGTGLVWDSLGDIVTNYHVISKIDKAMIPQATKVVIANASGSTSRTFNVELVGSDAMHDIAVLRIVDAADGSPIGSLKPVRIGASKDLKVGQYVFAIGNAYGLTRTQSAGIVSGLGRSIPSPVGTRIYGAIQTDASINAGNSGGPLFDSSALMVGMNTATFTRSGTGRGSGVNFALPVDLLLEVVPNLIVYGNSMGKKI